MRIGNNAPQIFQYPVSIESPDGNDETLKYSTFDIGKIVDRLSKKLEVVLGKYIHSGFNIWTTTQNAETYFFDTKFMGSSIKLKIDHEGEYAVNPSDIENPDRRDCQAMSQILNVIVKQAMSETGLLQFGHRPRFFDSSNPIDVPELDMSIWGGFKASAYKYQSGCALILDNCTRFMSTKTVLHRVHALFD